MGRSNGVAHERASSRWWAPSSALLWQGEAPLVRGRACGMMVMVPFLLGGTFFLDETTAKPARPLRSGFLFARGEHRRRPRVELTATRVGSTAMPRVLSRPSPEGPKLAPAQGHSYRAGAFLCRPPPRHLSWHEQISPDPRVTPTRQHNTRPAYPGQRPVSRARDSVNTTPYLCGSMLRPARKKPAKLRSWRASLIRKRAQYLGTVDAPNEKAAEAVAVAEFNLSDEQRRRLVVQERN